MNTTAQQDLQWQLLLEKLESYAQTTIGKERCRTLPCNLVGDTIEVRWQMVEPLKKLAEDGYKAPIGDLPEMAITFKGIKLGQILDSEALLKIFVLLDTSRRIHHFSFDFKERCPPLGRFHKSIYPLPNLIQAIEKTIDPGGEILDDASSDLRKIRRDKIALRKKIEQKIGELFTESDIEIYLQDKFFTKRVDRYVIPIRLDGRGRVKGSILDTSESGQTLYIEPASVAAMNEQLLELELSEKLEILRIFKELSAMIATEYDILKDNYEHLIELDFLTAQGLLAKEYDGTQCTIAKNPTLHLKRARHPLVTTPSKGAPIPNDITLDQDHCCLIISGPNAGGKTVALKTAGIIHLMLKAGLLLPLDPQSEIFIFDQIFVSMGDTQSITANLSTFSGHILTLKPILEKAKKNDLVLLDELAIGTDPETGSAIGQAILEHLADKGILTIATTHFDALKGLAINDQRFRNGSMEFSQKDLLPTYNLLLDIPGQSYGLEVAKQMGLKGDIIERARILKGSSSVKLDTLVESLSKAREEAEIEKKRYYQEKLELDAQKNHFQTERKNLENIRRKITQNLGEAYEDKTRAIRSELEATINSLKKLLKKAQKGNINQAVLRSEFEEDRSFGRQQVKKLEKTIEDLKTGPDVGAMANIDNNPPSSENVRIGQRVFVIPLHREAKVLSITQGSDPLIEVQAGLLKMKSRLNEIRLLKNPIGEQTTSPQATKKRVTANRSPKESCDIEYVIPTTTGTIDVRGKDADTALKEVWGFIDRALLRGESIVVIVHGHGTSKLKQAIRTALATDSPYDIDFRGGETAEGGDGVTIVKIKA